MVKNKKQLARRGRPKKVRRSVGTGVRPLTNRSSLRSSESKTKSNDDEEWLPNSNRNKKKGGTKSRGPIGSHGDEDDDDDDDEDSFCNPKLDEEAAADADAEAEMQLMIGFGGTMGKKSARKKGVGKKGVKKGGSDSNRPKTNMDWSLPVNYERLVKAKKDLADLLKAEAHLKRFEKTKLEDFFDRAKIPQQTWYKFKKDEEGFRKRASETTEERSVKYTNKAVKEKQASGNLCMKPKNVAKREASRKLNLGHVPKKGKRKREPVGGYSMNKVTQHRRGCHQKKIATNVAVAATTAVATDMVIKEDDAF